MPAVALHEISKAFRIGATHGSLRDAAPALLRRLSRRPRREANETLWALRDVSFEVERGQTLGVIGPNGAGKTTLLKILSGVTYPTGGSIHVDGRLSSLIELGAGFHPELTGRENVYLYGSILGIGRRRMAASFDRIVAFSELEKFIDTPIKRYSAGMFVRLGFAVAIHVEPDVLVVDEVLAVGDMAFQRKCLDKIEEIRARGTSVVLVSHNLRTVESLCGRALWLQGGRIRERGDVPSVVAAYTNAVNQAMRDGVESHTTPSRRGSGEVRLASVRVVDRHGSEPDRFRLFDPIIVEMRYRTRRRVDSPSFDVAVYANSGARVCTATTRLSGYTLPSLDGEGMVRCIFDSPTFSPGGYTVTAAIFDPDDVTMLDQWHHAAAFCIDTEQIGNARWQLQQEEHGVVYLPVKWEHR